MNNDHGEKPVNTAQNNQEHLVLQNAAEKRELQTVRKQCR